MFFVKFSDAQCGFKAVTREVADKLVKNLKDNEWFFDTELMYRAQRRGYRIKEVPVTWVEDAGTTVKTAPTVINYIKSTISLRLEFLGR